MRRRHHTSEFTQRSSRPVTFLRALRFLELIFYFGILSKSLKCSILFRFVESACSFATTVEFPVIRSVGFNLLFNQLCRRSRPFCLHLFAIPSPTVPPYNRPAMYRRHSLSTMLIIIWSWFRRWLLTTASRCNGDTRWRCGSSPSSILFVTVPPRISPSYQTRDGGVWLASSLFSTY